MFLKCYTCDILSREGSLLPATFDNVSAGWCILGTFVDVWNSKHLMSEHDSLSDVLYWWSEKSTTVTTSSTHTSDPLIIAYFNKYTLQIQTNTTLLEQSHNLIDLTNRRKRGNIDTPITDIHDRWLSWLGKGTSIKSGEVKLVLWAQIQNMYLLLLLINK
jgi:hypothetical protein